MATQKGFIQVLDKNLKKKSEIEVDYYPPEYTVAKTNSFEEISIAGLESPFIQFKKGNISTLTLKVFYDTLEQGTDVRKHVNKLTDLLNIDPEIHAPPPLLFFWGLEGSSPFYCVLESATKTYTMFTKDGIPVRARVDITLKEFKTDLNPREKSRQSPDKTKVRTITKGDSLWWIAYEEYGDPDRWREIANVNFIENPRALVTGNLLIIPPLE
ncbi:MAG: hypothetical protein WC379_05790 [Methanoregula sp.]|jgi:LysM repeat protein